MKTIKRETQYTALLKYLLLRGFITPIGCMRDLGFQRPDRRIVEVRDQFGDDAIITEMKRTESGSTYAVYKLNKKFKTKISNYLRMRNNKYSEEK
jgi:hypothetical protein